MIQSRLIRNSHLFYCEDQNTNFVITNPLKHSSSQLCFVQPCVRPQSQITFPLLKQSWSLLVYLMKHQSNLHSLAQISLCAESASPWLLLLHQSKRHSPVLTETHGSKCSVDWVLCIFIEEISSGLYVMCYQCRFELWPMRAHSVNTMIVYQHFNCYLFRYFSLFL